MCAGNGGPGKSSARGLISQKLERRRDRSAESEALIPVWQLQNRGLKQNDMIWVHAQTLLVSCVRC
jgi:hypothetical protein